MPTKCIAYCRKSEEDKSRQVLSIPAQETETRRLSERLHEARIVETIADEKSAWTPGRPGFDELIQRIEAGEIEGILAWSPDRLARNPVDGGRLVHLLDIGKLKVLQFCTYSFENTPHGKFMLGILFSESKFYSDCISQNVCRGMRTKIETGGWPSRAPTGYLNDQLSKTIIEDPERFTLMRRMMEMILTGTHTPERALRVMTDDWGFRTKPRARTGNKPLSLSGLYRILANPFYAGLIKWNDRLYAGQHRAMISPSEFERLQAILGRNTAPRPSRHVFAYTGLLRCGACGLAITAERKRNRYGSEYVYYRCTRRRRDQRCREPAITLPALERQLIEAVASFEIPVGVSQWINGRLRRLVSEETSLRVSQRATAERALTGVRRQLHNLTDLRVRDLVTDEEFVARRQTLELELHKLTRALTEDTEEEWIEPAMGIISLSNQAASVLRSGTDDEKRLVIRFLCSNPTLQRRKLSVHAAKPFRVWSSDKKIDVRSG